MRPTLLYQDQTLSADQFEARWKQSASALHQAGVGEGAVVALLMRNRPEAIELMLATRHLGGQWCPVNWHFLTDEVQYILANSGARVLVADDALLAALSGLDTTGVQVWTTTQWQTLRDATAATTRAAAAPRGAMFYTSGTTGRPKGIVRQPMSATQQGAATTMRRLAYGVDTDTNGAPARLEFAWINRAATSFPAPGCPVSITRALDLVTFSRLLFNPLKTADDPIISVEVTSRRRRSVFSRRKRLVSMARLTTTIN